MKLLAIDDQLAVLEMIKAQIDTEALGICQLDLASSAEMARRFFEIQFYEIVLCDIEMPGEDGISFARWLIEKYPEVKLIFLTSHMDFSYMKQAIAMHSFDYILQPATPAELNQVIQKAIYELKIEWRQRELQEKGKLYSEKENNIANWLFMKYLTDGCPMEEYFRDLFSRRHPKLRKETSVFLFSLRLLKEDERLSRMENYMSEFILGNILDELAENLQLKSLFAKSKPAEWLGMLYCTAEEVEVTKIQKLFLKLRRYLNDLTGTDLVLLFTESGKMEQVRELYQKLSRFSIGSESSTEGGIVWIGEENGGLPAVGTLDFHAQNWRKLLQNKAFENLEETVRAYIDKILLNPLTSMDDILNIHNKFTEVLFSYLAENEIKTGEIFTEEFSYSDYMSNYGITLEALKEKLLLLIGRLKKNGEKENQDPIEAASLFIRKKIGENISVVDVAEHVSLAPEYFTRLFKKQTGYSIKEFITNERLQTAKMLLTTTTLGVTAIASHVGYGDYNQFTKIFKKYEGCTPSEYRKSREESS